jgi:hypothetical protein
MTNLAQDCINLNALLSADEIELRVRAFVPAKRVAKRGGSTLSASSTLVRSRDIGLTIGCSPTSLSSTRVNLGSWGSGAGVRYRS